MHHLILWMENLCRTSHDLMRLSIQMHKKPNDNVRRKKEKQSFIALVLFPDSSISFPQMIRAINLLIIKWM